MRDLLEELVDAASRRADYADARFVHTRCETLSTRNGGRPSSTKPRRRASACACASAAPGGSPPPAAPAKADVEAALERALSRGGRRSRRRRRAPLAPEPPAAGLSTRPGGDAIRSRSRSDDKLGAARRPRSAAAASAVDRRAATGPLSRAVDDKVFASTEGALCEQRPDRVRRRHRGSGRRRRRDADALVSRLARRRTSPRPATSTSIALELAAHAPRVAEEASALLSAPACPSGTHHADPRPASSSRSRSTSRSATPSSSTACSGARPPTPARASCPPTPSARCATAPS